MSNGQQHIHMRKRLYKLTEPFPSASSLKRILDYGMYGVGLVAPLAIVPQVIQIYSTRSVAGLSFLTWGLLAVVNALWTLYGVVHGERVLFISNFLVACMNTMVCIGIVLFH